MAYGAWFQSQWGVFLVVLKVGLELVFSFDRKSFEACGVEVGWSLVLLFGGNILCGTM